MKVLYFSIRRGTDKAGDTFIWRMKQHCDFTVVQWREMVPDKNAPKALDPVYISMVAEHKPDMVLVMVNKPNVLSIEAIQSANVPVINWMQDERYPLQAWILHMAEHPLVRATLLASERCVGDLAATGKCAYLMMHSAEPSVHNRWITIPAVPFLIPPVVFLGSNTKCIFPMSSFRDQVVTSLRTGLGTSFGLYGSGWGEGIAEVKSGPFVTAISASAVAEISINHYDTGRCYSDRMFRTMALGTLCVSYRHRGIEKDFTDGEHLLTFSTANECVALCQRIVACPSAYRKIAENGSCHVLQNHTGVNRADQMWDIIRECR